MQFKNILAFLAAASAVQASMDLDFERSLNSLESELDERDELTLEERANGCVKGVHVVAAGGEGTKKGDLGYLQSTVDGITAAIPHSSVFQVPCPSQDGPTDIASAWPKMKKHIRAYAKKCPRTKMALVGYSVGGAVVMNSICGDATTGNGGIAKKYHKNIVATVVYGDPTFLPNLSYDKGTCTGAQGPSDVPRAYPGHCHPFGKHAISFCDYNDPECCNGNDVNVHFAYPSKYDPRVAKFVQRRFKNSKKHHKGKGN